MVSSRCTLILLAVAGWCAINHAYLLHESRMRWPACNGVPPRYRSMLRRVHSHVQTRHTPKRYLNPSDIVSVTTQLLRTCGQESNI
jgi:hypothetical protein